MTVANQHVALEVRAHLARRRLKRADLAAVLGVSLRTVSDLLGERRAWRLDELEAVARWLGLELADLLPAKARGRAR
ncbi:transcriptional regulator, XRE family [Segniliparus rotundus DSM 44985]|uniref:Transcriptional regulator, XRE family n=1 Tax=Segniliparus rotundus (strain ATCC BAA-972 / CDC 1076 / CIP 108378 / DSM 44985 / JCM 13578) TaxID=640132 RepID=D6ZF98_SEGRD|nr:helix-turn-helix transcriptional regulator [Segniliparus rotundus]ADG97622.1 transcriptional regulator, XRE family [Segniliparus rotundus DSM 44985]